MNELRLNKALASAGLCSRRKADELIFAGAVAVNGVRVTEPGTRIDPLKDEVRVHGNLLQLAAKERKHTYLLLHKPVQVVSTAKDPQGRTTVLDLLPEEYKTKRLYPVGRLDYFSEGLLLLTDDGGLSYHLMHPRYHLAKKYMVRVRETVTEGMLAAMRRGMTLAEGERLAPVEAAMSIEAPDTLLLTLRQGVNRQIRRMCRDLGLTILTLRRVAIGPVQLGSLAKGQCRPLQDDEVRALRAAVDMGGSGLRSQA